MPPKKEKQGCGCTSIPISLILVLFGASYWGFTQRDTLLAHLNISQFLPNNQPSPQQPTPSNPQLQTSTDLTPTPDPSPSVVTSPVEPSPTASHRPLINRLGKKRKFGEFI